MQAVVIRTSLPTRRLRERVKHRLAHALYRSGAVGFLKPEVWQSQNVTVERVSALVIYKDMEALYAEQCQKH